jgi:GDP-L-fucose synthase
MIDWRSKKVLVTGGAGFLGTHIVKILKDRGALHIEIPRSKDCDLTIRENCTKVVKDIDIVFHLAAKVGGIGLNLEEPGRLFFENLIMGIQLMEEARRAGVEKFMTVGTICSYPKFTPIPFSEDNLWDGYPEETNAPYGLAKKMLLVQSQAYRQQYGFNSTVLFPTNLYGPRDNFDPRSSHVIPALIRKIYEAKKNGSKSIVVWGDGSPTRDFLFVEDAARGIVMASERYNKSDPVNLGTGREVSIRELVKMICKLMEFKGRVKWDTSKPGGQPRRCVSIERAKKEFGWEPQVSLLEGLRRTINWYRAS